MFLAAQDFTSIIEKTPLISIDLLVSNSNNQYLLGKRVNQPAKNFWFVPGGRVYKNETMADAFHRLTYSELGITKRITEAQFHGVYEHFYGNSVFESNISTHYVVLAYQIILEPKLFNLPTGQHSKYEWFSKTALMQNETVHKYTKNYFQ